MLIFITIFFSLLIIEILYLRYAHNKDIKDNPNHRSAHIIPTTRGGGIIFIPATLLFLVLFYEEIDNSLVYFIASVFIVSIISFVDDLKTLSSRIRIVFHFIALSIAFMGIEFFDNFSALTILISLFAYFFSLGFLNIYNFMDGINGMTFLNALCSYITLYLINTYIINFTNGNLIIVFAIATVVFGYFNFRKKPKCFAGDVGSITIGFTIIYFTLKLYQVSQNNWTFLILGVYLIDGGWTILERLLRKENVFEAHRRHLYQLLVNEIKIPHLIVSTSYFFIQVILNIIVIYSLKNDNNDILTLVFLSVFLSFIYYIFKQSTYKKVK